MSFWGALGEAWGPGHKPSILKETNPFGSMFSFIFQQMIMQNNDIILVTWIQGLVPTWEQCASLGSLITYAPDCVLFCSTSLGNVTLSDVLGHPGSVERETLAGYLS